MGNIPAYESDVKIVSSGLLAGSDLSSYQYHAVKIASDVVEACDTLGEFTIGILQNAPDVAGKPCSIGYGGISQVKIGGSVSQQNRLTPDVDAMLIAQTDPDEAVIAIALSDGVDGDRIPAIVCIGTALNSAIAERALANTKIWIGNSSGEAAAFALSGHATMTAGGVVTVTDIDTTAASDASGDIIYRDSGSTFERLAKGTTLQILAMNAGATAPEWIDQSAITSAAQTDIGTTAAGDAIGDVIYRDAADTFERLAIGTAAQVLATNGGATAPEWISQSAMTVGNATDAVTAATATDVATTAAGDAIGDILYRDAAATLERLAIGTASQILQTNAGATAPEWNTVSGDGSMVAGVLTVDNITVGSDVAGDVNYKTSATASTRLPIGNPGDTLRVNTDGDAPEWINADKVLSDDFNAYAATDQVANIQPDGTAADLTADVLNHLYTPNGNVFCFEALGAGQTLPPVITADGLDIAGDDADDEGYELFSHFLGATGKPFIIGTDAAFFFLIKLKIQTIDGTDDFQVGFRRAEICRPNWDDYLDAAAIGCLTEASPMLIQTQTILNGGATGETSTTQTLAAATAVQFKIMVSAAGVTTFQHDIVSPGTLAAPTAAGAFTFDSGDPVIPFCRYLNVAGQQVNDFPVYDWDVGYQ